MFVLELGVGHAEQWQTKFPTFRGILVDRRALSLAHVIVDAESGFPFRSNTMGAVFSSHMLEHLSVEGAHRCLRESYRVLFPGGCLVCYLPDLAACVAEYAQQGLTQRVRDNLVGQQRHEWDFHRSVWDRHTLTTALTHAGFTSVVAGPGRAGDELFGCGIKGCASS